MLPAVSPRLRRVILTLPPPPTETGSWQIVLDDRPVAEEVRRHDAEWQRMKSEWVRPEQTAHDCTGKVYISTIGRFGDVG